MNKTMIVLTAIGTLALVGELDAQRQGRGAGRGRQGPPPAAAPMQRSAPDQVAPRPAARRLRAADATQESSPRPGRGQGPRGGRGVALREQVCVQPDCAVNLTGRTTSVAVPAAFLAKLTQVRDEELAARDAYRALSDSTGMPRYANLAEAEARHADAVDALIRYLGGSPPARPEAAAGTIAATEPCAELERRMIEVYATLIETSPDPVVTAELERIQAANRRHLSAVTDDRPVRRGRGR